MRKYRRTLWLVLFAMPLAQVSAQEINKQPPAKYRMELIYIFEGGKTEYIFAIGNSGFHSVASLKKFIGRLPKGSTLEWAPGCDRFGDEPLLSSQKEMEAFKVYCEKNGIHFVLIPSG